MDEAGLVVELLDLGIVGVDEVDNLLDRDEVLSFLFDEQMDRQVLVVVCSEHTHVGLHVEKIGAELVDLSESGVAVKGVDIVGGEGDGSGIRCWERHVNVFTAVRVTL